MAFSFPGEAMSTTADVLLGVFTKSLVMALGMAFLGWLVTKIGWVKRLYKINDGQCFSPALYKNKWGIFFLILFVVAIFYSSSSPTPRLEVMVSYQDVPGLKPGNIVWTPELLKTFETKSVEILKRTIHNNRPSYQKMDQVFNGIKSSSGYIEINGKKLAVIRISHDSVKLHAVYVTGFLDGKITTVTCIASENEISLIGGQCADKVAENFSASSNVLSLPSSAVKNSNDGEHYIGDDQGAATAVSDETPHKMDIFDAAKQVTSSESRAVSAMKQAAGTNPDEYAKHLDIANRTGLPVSAVQIDPKDAEAGLFDNLNYDAALNAVPTAKDWFVDNAPLISDDFSFLARLGRAVFSTEMVVVLLVGTVLFVSRMAICSFFMRISKKFSDSAFRRFLISKSTKLAFVIYILWLLFLTLSNCIVHGRMFGSYSHVCRNETFMLLATLPPVLLGVAYIAIRWVLSKNRGEKLIHDR